MEEVGFPHYFFLHKQFLNRTSVYKTDEIGSVQENVWVPSPTLLTTTLASLLLLKGNLQKTSTEPQDYEEQILETID